MNPILSFYLELLRFVTEDQDVPHKHGKMMELAKKHPELSWKVTSEHLSNVHYLCNNRDKMEEAEHEERDNVSGDMFMLALFKDLSVMKNPDAHKLFKKFNNLMGFYNCFLTLFAKKVVKREDGSGVVLLHVSHLDLFEQLILNEACMKKNKTLTAGNVLSIS